MKSVLHIGVQSPYYSSSGIAKGFHESGFEDYSFINFQSIRVNYGVEYLRKQMIDVAIENKPDLIFCHIQVKDVLDIETAKALSDIGFVLNFTEDCRNDVSWYEEISPHIGLTVFTNYEDVETLKSKGLRSEYLQTSYNDLIYHPLKQKPTADYGEIIFIGNNQSKSNLNFPFAEERVEMVNCMKKEFGERFKVWGNNWGNSRVLTPNESNIAYNSCRIAITQNQYHRKGYTSDRTFNAFGSGAIVIQQHYDGYYQDFKTTPFLLSAWQSFDDLKILCKHKFSPRNIEQSKENIPYMKERHTWKNRIEKLKEYIIHYDPLKQKYLTPTIRVNA